MRVVSDRPRPGAVPRALAPEERGLFSALGGGPETFVADLPAPAFWNRLYRVEEAPASQFDALCSLAREGRPLPAPLLTVATRGHGFHGHRGREWAVLPGNVHLSALFRPDGRPASDALGMVMLPALATVDAVRSLSRGRLSPVIKWVNDVLVEGRKVAGVLTSTSSREDRLECAILGVGLNVEQRPEVAPTPFVPSVACLRDFPGGEAIAVDEAVLALAGALARRAGMVLARGPGALFPEYRGLSMVRGRHARVLSEEGALLAEGVVEDVRPDLRLEFAGQAEPVDRGRLVLV